MAGLRPTTFLRRTPAMTSDLHGFCEGAALAKVDLIQEACICQAHYDAARELREAWAAREDE
jgi:hypothetical protein